eukprot:767086-Hanusia_phi.AAC.2
MGGYIEEEGGRGITLEWKEAIITNYGGGVEGPRVGIKKPCVWGWGCDLRAWKSRGACSDGGEREVNDKKCAEYNAAEAIREEMLNETLMNIAVD